MTDIANITGIEAPDESVLDEVKEEQETEQEQPVAEEEAKPKKRGRRSKAQVEQDALEEALRGAELISAIASATRGTDIENILALNCETPEDEVGYRPANFKDPQGKQLAYVDARYVMDVLDREVGPENWSTDYVSLDNGAVECTITVHLRGGNYVRKTDIGVPSTIEAQKGAYSDAFKRAAVHFGIARDLYDERMADAAPAPAPAAAPAAVPAAAQQTIAQATEGGDAPTGEVAQPAAEQTVASWVCPIHGTGRVQPAGVSKRTGKAYSAFWVCDTPGCRQTGGNA